jgi:mannose/fructose/N-acetylgalactosamine-specific phosphotransferase system component IIC
MTLFNLLINDPMFSQGQLLFAILFFVAFVIVIFLMYRKDKVLHRKNYRGVKWILIGFLAFFLVLLAIKFGLKQ